MHLPGGPTDKFGNYYEGKWTVLCLIELLRGEADKIRLEPPGEDGFEFYLAKGKVTEFHQVKTGPGWTIAKLIREGVLPDFLVKLNDPSHECHLITAEGASELRKLSERARNARDFEEFCVKFLNDEESKSKFESVAKALSTPNPELGAFERLRRIYVTIIDENQLDHRVADRLYPMYEDDSRTVADVLAQFSLANIHRELSGTDIQAHLVSREITKRLWAVDSNLSQIVSSETEHYLQSLQQTTIPSMTILRKECTQIEEQFQANKFLFVSGTAGIGKSHVLGQTIEHFKSKSWPILAFRLDRLDPNLANTNVWSQINLPGSPVHVLASIAKGRDCLLVIDQLDAVSLASGRSVSFFNRIEDLLREAQMYPNLKILFGCRRFDIEYDPNFKKLVKDNNEVRVQLLTQDEIKAVLSSLQVEISRIREEQWKLLALPLNLGLLSEVLQDTEQNAFDFNTANELFNQYWQLKTKRLSGSKWTDALNKVCHYMSSNQILSAPKIILDGYFEDAAKLISENILVEQNNRYAFFHETFFDYVYARQFVASQSDLLTLLLTEGQGLFRRAQIRQILTFLREAESEKYHQILVALLNHSNIRFHIKEAVFGFLRSVSQPSHDEWQILQRFLFSENKGLHREACKVLRLSPAWFKLIDELGMIKQWIESETSDKQSEAINLIRIHQDTFPDRIADLLEPYVDKSDEWNQHIANVLFYTEFGDSRKLFDLLLKLIDLGKLDGYRRPPLHFGDLVKTKPEWCCEAIGRFLKRRLAIFKASGEMEGFRRAIEDNDFLEDIVTDAAEKAPDKYISEILPFMMEAVELTAYEKERIGSRMDAIWFHPMLGENSLADKIILSMGRALAILAERSPEEASSLFDSLKRTDYHSSQFLLCMGFQGNLEYFAEEAIDYLTESPLTRLETGCSSNAYWASIELIKKVTPYASDQKMASLEITLLSFYPEIEETKDAYFHKIFGLRQYRLLEGIHPDKRSPSVIRRIQEWQRKFGVDALDPPSSLRSGWVTSPLEREILEKLSDDQWLRAIAKYNSDRTPFGSGKDWLKGGALELSREIEFFTKNDPERFANLLLKLPDDTNIWYFEATLRGINASSFEPGFDLLEQVIQKVQALPGQPCGKEISDLIGKYANLDIPRSPIDILAKLAINGNSPKGQPSEEYEEDPNEPGLIVRGLVNDGMNSERGRAVNELGSLIWEDPNRIEYLLPVLQQVVVDPSMAVRSMAARTLICILNHNRELAVLLTTLLLKDIDELLLGTQFVERLIFYCIYTHFSTVKPIIEQMLSSQFKSVKMAGARLAMQAMLIESNDNLFPAACFDNSIEQRKGFVQVLYPTVKIPEYQNACVHRLVDFFNDEDEKVRSLASKCFRTLETGQLESMQDIIKSFLESRAFQDNYDDIIYVLDEESLYLPDIAFEVCEKFIEIVGDEASDTRTSAAGTAHHVTDILLKVYSQTKDQTVKEKSLDIIDKLLEIGAYSMGDRIDRYERLL
jgi:hypothetical protein